MKKIIAVILLCLTLSGCYDSEEISRLAFIMAIGIDTADDGLYEYTFQAVNPSAFDSGSDAEPLTSTTIKAETVYSAMDKLNTQISEKSDYSHLKLVLFSDSMLEKGIQSHIKAMLNSNGFHPNTRIAMAKGKASDYLTSLKIPLETNPAEYYENIFKKGYTVYSPDTKLRDMEQKYSHLHNANVLPVVTTAQTEDDDEQINSQTLEGMAITKDLKFSALASSNEVFWYNMLTDRSFKGNIYIPIPSTDKSIAVELNRKRLQKSIDLSGGQPMIYLNIRIEGGILWSEHYDTYIADDKSFEAYVREKAESEITEFLYKCSNEYKADIFDFAESAKTKYLTINAWEAENWDGLFAKANYSVDVKINIKREGNYEK